MHPAESCDLSSKYVHSDDSADAVGRGAGQLTTSIAGAFPDKQTREGALSTVSRVFVGGLNQACQTVLHPLEAIQLICSSPQAPYEGSGGDAATQKAAEEEERSLAACIRYRHKAEGICHQSDRLLQPTSAQEAVQRVL